MNCATWNYKYNTLLKQFMKVKNIEIIFAFCRTDVCAFLHSTNNLNYVSGVSFVNN